MPRFVITADVISAEFNEPTNVPEAIFDPEATGGQPFRLYDDDGNLYYRGRLYDEGDTLTGFEPLDWGMGFAGCTAIKYRDPETGAWVWL